jgi:periplasmic protein CpxP/Spy
MSLSLLKTTRSPGARLASTALLVAVLGTVTLSAWAMPGGHGGGHGGPGMGMMMGGRGLERMLDGVNASAEQRTQIKAIAERTMADMKAQRETGKGTREQMMKLFAQPTVDANAVEALRAQKMQQHDQSSRRMTQAMLDVSRVLTPEQRKQLADRAAQRGSMMERHMNERRSMEGGATPR